MGSARCVIVTCIVFTVFLPSTDALACYQCGSAGMDGHCKKDVGELWKSADKVLKKRENLTVSDDPDDIWKDKDVTIPHIKQCNTNRNVCIIEEVVNSQTDAVLSYIRDCSDGKTLSFENLTMLQGLNTKNFTTCAYEVKGYLICVTLCDTDFCNGPKADASVVTSTIALQVLGLLGVHAIMNIH